MSVQEKVFNKKALTAAIEQIKNPQKEKNKGNEEFVDQFKNKKTEVEESNVGKVPGNDNPSAEELEEAEAKNILGEVVNFANN